VSEWAAPSARKGLPAALDTPPAPVILHEMLPHPGKNDEGSEPLSTTIYRHLHAIARAKMAGERPDHTLSPTALVHEAFVKFKGDLAIRSNAAGFYRAVADAMRQLLIDHARRKAAERRGGAAKKVADATDTFESLESLADAADPGKIVALERAFLRLQQQDQRAADIVRLRFFAGLSVDQTAEALGLSRRTVLRDWEFARASLLREIELSEPPP
jgi:RNA polymerase sigma factor (TIGR02999 family)